MRRTIASFLVLVAAGCAGSDPSLDLLEDPVPDDTSWDSRRAMMNINVERLNGQGAWGSPISLDYADATFQSDVGAYCESVVRASSATFSGCAQTDVTAPALCPNVVCGVQIATCMSLTYLELASAVTATELRWGSSGIRVPPQSTATNAGLREQSLRFAQIATELSGENLRRAAGDTSATSAKCTVPADLTTMISGPTCTGVTPQASCEAIEACRWNAGACTTECSLHTAQSTCNARPTCRWNTGQSLCNPLTGPTYGQSLASSLVETSILAERAGRESARDHVAVADTDLTRIVSPGDAMRTGWTAPVLSHLRASQIMIGGTGFQYQQLISGPAVFSNMTHLGMCSARCDAACQRATQVLRDSGLGLSVLGDVTRFQIDGSGNRVDIPGISLVDVLQGTGPVLGFGGVQDRLSQRYGVTEIGAGTTTYADFLTRTGLSRNDFEAARTHLVQTATVFDRDLNAVSPPPRREGGAAYSYVQSAATTTPPREPDGAFYVANVRGGGDESDDRVGGQTVDFVYPTTSYADRSVAHTVDYAQTVARQVIGGSQQYFSSPMRETVQDILGTLVAQSMGGDSRRIESCYRYYNGYDQLRVRIYGETRAKEHLELVRGTAGVECATTGLVEGQPCRLADYIAPLNTRGDGTPSDVRVGYDRYVQLETFALTYPSPNRFYVVRLRPDSTRAGVAGNYESLGEAQVLTYPGSGVNYWYCHANPVEPEVERVAIAAMSHQTDSCDQPANDCYGAPLAGRLPLEDELIDDGDPYETSWRHHLQVARAAADRADELGEELIDIGLRMDQRAEFAVEELEEACGPGISLDGIFGPSGAGITSPLSRVISGTCPTGTCAAGYTCIGTGANRLCALDAVAAAGLGPSDARALAECLGQDTLEGGSSTLVPVVALGSTPLCYWRENPSTNVICSPDALPPDVSHPCPYPVPESGTCQFDDPRMPPGTTLVLQNGNEWGTPSEELGIFLTGAAAAGTGFVSAEPIECRWLRELRAFPSEIDVFPDVRDSNFFMIPNVRLWAERIGWRGYPNDFSMLTLDGSPWYGTGIPFQSLSGQFPAGPFRHDPDGAGMLTPISTWPCDMSAGMDLNNFRDESVVPPPDCPSGDTSSLFCSSIDCNDAAARAHFNDRLARAAMALGVTSGVGLGNVWLPVQYDFDPSPIFEGESPAQADWQSNNWRVFSSMQWGSDAHDRYSGLYAIPQFTPPSGGVWRRPYPDGTGLGPPFQSSASRPLGFVSFGTMRGRYADPLSEAMWGGLTNADPYGVSTVGRRLSPWSALAGFPIYERVDDRACVGGTDAPEDRAIRVMERVLTRGGDHLEIDTMNGRCLEIAANLSVYYKEPGEYIRVGESSPVNHNGPMIAREGFHTRDLQDAMELMCEAARYATQVENCDPEHPPAISTARDIPQLRSYLYCIAARLERQGENVVIQNVPRRVVQQIRGEAVAQRPEDGDYGRSIVNLRQALGQLRTIPRLIARQLQEFANDLEALENAIAHANLTEHLADLNAMGSIAGAAGACATESARGSFAAIAQCATSAAQIVIQLQITDTTEDLIGTEMEGRIIDFRDSWQLRQQTLAQLGDSVTRASEDAQRELTNLAQTRKRGARALARALFFDSDEAGQHFQVNTAMRRIYNTRLRRYQVAHRSAVQMAILARRALEQRLGVDMAVMTRPMTLVDRPADWANSVCESSGIDYARIRDATDLPNDNFADAYVGDYVDNLERFFESYRLDFPYTSGESTAVISLRDDVLNVRTTCEVPVYNLLAMSDDLSAPIVVPESDEERDAAAEVVAAWSPANCTPVSGAIVGCVDAYPVSPGPSESPLSPTAPRVRLGIQPEHTPTAFRVTFAAGTNGTGSPAVSYTPNTELQQIVQLQPGTYRLSWYGKTVTSGFSPQTAVSLTAAAGVSSASGPWVVPLPAAETAAGRALADGWSQYTHYYRVTTATAARVRIHSGYSGTPTAQSVDLAGLMLENVTDRVGTLPTTQLEFNNSVAAETHPRQFVATRMPARATLQECEDTFGSEFRRRWAYHCDQLCDAGFSSCPPVTDATDLYRCYWETEFTIDHDSIDSGSILGSTGFAVGNFNYRIGDLALNFVGSGARTCTDVARPSTCYNSGYIPYSVRHLPSYAVLDYDGHDYEAQLFEGRIEGALGLAAERYLGNPLSSADGALIDGYRRRELRGRPFSGRFLVRVWDVPGVNFGGIEDVQILLDYRYFTRTPAPPVE